MCHLFHLKIVFIQWNHALRPKQEHFNIFIFIPHPARQTGVNT